MDFGIIENITTWEDRAALTDQSDINEFNAIYNDRACSFFVRNKTRDNVISILQEITEDVGLNIDYMLINKPASNEGGAFGTHLICDPAKRPVIEQAIYNYDNTILEGEWSTILATKSRLEAL